MGHTNSADPYRERLDVNGDYARIWFVLWNNQPTREAVREILLKVAQDWLYAAERCGVDNVPASPLGAREEADLCVYLYDAKAYDSDLELEDIGCDSVSVPEVDSVTVYGKIPTKSVAIPTIMGGTYSPDFMYVVKRKGGKSELNVVIEVKDVEKESDLHKSEEMKIKCAEIFYEMLRKDGIDVRYQKQLKNQKLADFIAQVIQKTDVRYDVKVDAPEEERFKTRLPFYSALVKCGPLADGEEVSPDGWVKVEGHGVLDSTQFVVKTEGISMEGLIPDGAYVIFRKLGGGDLEGKTVLVQCHEAHDPESGGSYTVKRFARKGDKVILKAKNPKFDIELHDEVEYSTKYCAIAEFKSVL